MMKHIFLALVAFLVAGLAEAHTGATDITEGEMNVQLQWGGSSKTIAALNSFTVHAGRLDRLALEMVAAPAELDRCGDMVVLTTVRPEVLPEILRQLDQHRQLEADQTRVLKSYRTWHLIKIPGFDLMSLEDRASALRSIVDNNSGVQAHQCFNSKETNRTSSGNKGGK